MKKIAIIEKIHDEGLKLLENNSNFNYELIENASEENLINKLPEFDGCTLRVSELNENILKHCPKLKVISRHGVGYNNIDTNFIKKNNITLLIANNANQISVAEHVMYMMLSISKGILSHDQSVRSGFFKEGVKNIMTFELQNKKILIIGFGRIGKALIRMCKSFYMKVIVYDPYVDKKIISDLGGEKVENLNKSLQTADYVSLHVPLTSETKNMINIDNIKGMKPTSILINTSRGSVVNEIDLNNAINDKIIFGAGIDVFETEPVKISNPLLKNKRVILSPHTATWTNECKIRMAKITIQNIIDFFEKRIDKSMLVKL